MAQESVRSTIIYDSLKVEIANWTDSESYIGIIIYEGKYMQHMELAMMTKMAIMTTMAMMTT